MNKNQQPGFHSVYWDGSDNSGTKVTSGAYFYRLESGGTILTRKMVVIR